MKMEEVPKWAFDVESIKAPTKVVIDWEALMGVLLTQGWVVLEADDLILENNQSHMVKLLNNRVRGTYSRKFYTKRIGLNRWFCRLGENYKRKPR